MAGNMTNGEKIREWIKVLTPIAFYILLIMAAYFTLKFKVSALEEKYAKQETLTEKQFEKIMNRLDSLDAKVSEIYWTYKEREKNIK